MTKERFTEILKEYGYDNYCIMLLWKTRPTDDLDEATLRKVAREEYVERQGGSNDKTKKVY